MCSSAFPRRYLRASRSGWGFPRTPVGRSDRVSNLNVNLAHLGFRCPWACLENHGMGLPKRVHLKEQRAELHRSGSVREEQRNAGGSPFGHEGYLPESSGTELQQERIKTQRAVPQNLAGAWRAVDSTEGVWPGCRWLWHEWWCVVDSRWLPWHTCSLQQNSVQQARAREK